MTRRISFVYKDKKYVLEYTKSSIKEMERRGFVIEEVLKKPLSMLPDMFAGAFLAHHRFVKEDVINNIYTKLTKKEDLIGKLAEMYNEPIMALVEEPEEDKGNVNWTATW